MELSGKVALVTGGARRVGRAIALELGRAGARVAVHHHGSPKEADEVVRTIGNAFAVQADLRTAAGCEAAVNAIGGRADVVVNSAAGFLHAPFAQITDAQWEETLALTLMAPVRLVRALRPAAIVNILDLAALQAWRDYSAHCAAKAALAMLTRCWAVELAPHTRTNGIAPGTVLFPESFTAEQRARITRKIPLGHEGSPEDVARAVRFLCEEDFLNGVILPVDGGRLAESGENY
jgi:pteridine reductase